MTESADWNEPLDESPIDTPNGWTGGHVEAIGAAGGARLWRHETDDLEVVYNLHNERVVLREADDLTMIDVLEAARVADDALAHAAAALMSSYNHGWYDEDDDQ